VFHIVDVFVKWSAAVAITTKAGETILKCLQQTFPELGGKPRILQSDNAGEFTGEPVASFLQEQGIEMRNSRPRHPQSNGVVERTGGILKKSLYRKIADWKSMHPTEKLDLEQVNGILIFVYDLIIHTFQFCLLEL
jgi:transposase InsO family protein